MNHTTRRLVALSGALAIAFGAAACSTAEPGTMPTASSTAAAPAPKASEIVEKAKLNAKAATSGAFKGEIKEDGKTIKIDFKGTSDGSTSDVSIEMGSEGKVRLLSVGGSLYMQADPVFWKAQGAPKEVQNAGEKFVKVPAGAGSGMLKDMTINSFLDEAFGELAVTELTQTVSEEKVDGVDCWVITDKAGKQQGALYVSKDTSEVVRFLGSTTSPGQIDFSSWNADLGIKAPPADQVMNVS